ncbi:hypothetical protein IMSHALPRED_003224 [Imshaugia aleurites]|uniref:Uncharacterized protein n=1 Tax=Imshaugia aleurites TaxID=172621 RepID=A0A8H3IFE0_9LECA|nr:hypothetical protein IMSHALPRED_003224 [Imshaugia aleurites]
MVRSNSEIDPRLSVTSQTSNLDGCRSALEIQDTTISKPIQKTIFITETSVHTTTNRNLREQINPPLWLALARRSVKKQIFTYMDQGDRKEEIESRTGLSHRCIKWHRRLWRNEGNHPRPRSKKISKDSARDPRLLGTQSERLVRGRPPCGGKGDSSVVAESNHDEKRRRKHRAVWLSKGRTMCTRVEMLGLRGGQCAEREKRGLDRFAGKHNVPEPDEGTMSGDQDLAE